MLRTISIESALTSTRGQPGSPAAHLDIPAWMLVTYSPANVVASLQRAPVISCKAKTLRMMWLAERCIRICQAPPSFCVHDCVRLLPSLLAYWRRRGLTRSGVRKNVLGILSVFPP